MKVNKQMGVFGNKWPDIGISGKLGPKKRWFFVKFEALF